MSKKDDLNFIKKMSNITIKYVCELEDVNYKNLLSGKAGVEATHRVAKRLFNILYGYVKEGEYSE